VEIVTGYAVGFTIVQLEGLPLGGEQRLRDGQGLSLFGRAFQGQ
jgi:hypothetical protein